MTWAVRITDDARAMIERLPARVRRQVSRHIDQLEQDPFQGDVKALRGTDWENCYRKRSGDYRIIYTVSRKLRIVDVLLVLLRSERTYG